MNAINLSSKSSTPELRAAMGIILAELRSRAKSSKPASLPAPVAKGKTPPAAIVAPSLPESKAKVKAPAKPQQAAVKYGVKRMTDGKMLKRVYADRELAMLACLELSKTTGFTYNPTLI